LDPESHAGSEKGVEELSRRPAVANRHVLESAPGRMADVFLAAVITFWCD
jgi:hypothetical protein